MQLLWSRRDKNGNVSLKDVRISIYEAAGTSNRTVAHYIRVLKELGWLKRINRGVFKPQEEFLTGDMF